jgi:hypothetical protein
VKYLRENREDLQERRKTEREEKRKNCNCDIYGVSTEGLFTRVNNTHC